MPEGLEAGNIKLMGALSPALVCFLQVLDHLYLKHAPAAPRCIVCMLQVQLSKRCPDSQSYQKTQEWL